MHLFDYCDLLLWPTTARAASLVIDISHCCVCRLVINSFQKHKETVDCATRAVYFSNNWLQNHYLVQSRKSSLKRLYHWKQHCRNSSGTYFTCLTQFKLFYTKCSMFWRNAYLSRQMSPLHQQWLINWHITLLNMEFRFQFLQYVANTNVLIITWVKLSRRWNNLSQNRCKNIGVSKIFLQEK
jgi:hypothetical protein